jgi:hypothetical protein
MSHQYDMSFCDACHILEGDNVFWDSLLTFVLCVMDDYLCTTVVTNMCRNFSCKALCLHQDCVTYPQCTLTADSY